MSDSSGAWSSRCRLRRNGRSATRSVVRTSTPGHVDGGWSRLGASRGGGDGVGWCRGGMAVGRRLLWACAAGVGWGRGSRWRRPSVRGVTRTAGGEMRRFPVERLFHVEQRRGQGCMSVCAGPAVGLCPALHGLSLQPDVAPGESVAAAGLIRRTYSASGRSRVRLLRWVTAVPRFTCLGRRGPESLRSGLVRVVGSSALRTELHATDPSSTSGCAVGGHGADAWPCGPVWLCLGGDSW